MSCCSEYDEEHSARRLIHDLSAPWVDQEKPVYVDFMGTDGKLVLFVVEGVSVTATGQSLELRQVQ